ncbi:MAG: dTDP-4-dehydrorhamnose 3,5-epimerase family protein [Candidatus Lernaella stagnicola]|nr:dTDP-4-dehydrorhamnose 3,5-epimerase family protein [Candidatus Lernaella stagnicola]
MIEGVKTKKLKPIPDERGRLMEILRADDDIFEAFGQVYITTAFPGVVKAWHYHKNQDDHFCVLTGMMKVVLFDSRENSATFREVNEFFLGVHNPVVVKIPAGVYHGFKCVGEQEAMCLNVPTKPYNHDEPDEFRLPWDTDQIPYDWSRRNY